MKNFTLFNPRVVMQTYFVNLNHPSISRFITAIKGKELEKGAALKRSNLVLTVMGPISFATARN